MTIERWNDGRLDDLSILVHKNDERLDTVEDTANNTSRALFRITGLLGLIAGGVLTQLAVHFLHIG